MRVHRPRPAPRARKIGPSPPLQTTQRLLHYTAAGSGNLAPEAIRIVVASLSPTFVRLVKALPVADSLLDQPTRVSAVNGNSEPPLIHAQATIVLFRVRLGLEP